MLGFHVGRFCMAPIGIFFFHLLHCRVDLFFRISSTKKTWLIMLGACLFRLSLAATRRPSQLVLATLNTTLYTFQLEMYGTLFVVHIGTQLSQLAFLPFRKVCGFVHVEYDLTKLSLSLGDRKYDNDPAFRKFKRQLYHSSISAILATLKPAMSTPAVYRCPDGHFRHIIFGLGPFIADYPEQVILAGLKQGWCPRYVLVSFYNWFYLLILLSCTALPTNIDGAASV